MMSNMPSQKIGIETPISATSVLAKSAAVFFFTAAVTPSRMPRIDARMIEQIASSIVAGKRAIISFITG